MKAYRDIIIIGGGPAGLSAAKTAASYGLDALVLDEQSSPGGQIYRNIENASRAQKKLLGADYRKGAALAADFRKSGAEFLGNAVVWRIDPNGNVCFSREGNSREINGKYIIIATGAMERPVPFPGWTLPGVMGAGAVDANFKSSGTVPTGPVVLAGCGPLLMLTAGHLVASGIEIRAILDTNPPGNFLTGLPFLPKALKRPDYLLKGMFMLLEMLRAGKGYFHNVTAYKAHGKDAVDHVSFKNGNGEHTVEAKALLVHEGVIPRPEFTRQIGLTHLWNPVQRFWYPKTTGYGATQLDKIRIAGDGAFVHGGIPALIKGALTAFQIARELKVASDKKLNAAATELGRRLRAELSPRPFVDALYKPRPHLYSVPDEAMVCRCEGVTAGDIRKAVSEGLKDPNEIKIMTRCGMGPCQGRMCGVGLMEIMAEELRMRPDLLTPLNIRPPVRNLSLTELAGLRLLEDENS